MRCPCCSPLPWSVSPKRMPRLERCPAAGDYTYVWIGEGQRLCSVSGRMLERRLGRCSARLVMDTAVTPTTNVRKLAHRTRGAGHGPIVRLMSPGDLGEILKPFVFLDLFDFDGASI